ncbi:MAG: polymerase, partial [Burkholderiales bacterium]|nr:polymerase [Burkholderiales bacterium]
MDKTLLLIDGSSFIFRAFHAMPDLTSPGGQPTGAIYGIINMFKQMQKKFPTKNWGCIFDMPGKTFRDDIHPEYKANRKETPADLISQFEEIYILVKALGIPVIMQNGIEADDLIGTIAVKAKQSGYKVIIATGDKDFAQLVDDNITLINTMNNEILDIPGVINKFGVKPEQIIDYLSLVGDKVDNIPGVDKCGPKTAVKWLSEYGTVESLIMHKDKLSGVVGENFRQSINWLSTAKTLITIDTSVDLNNLLPNGLNALTVDLPDKQILQEKYTTLGFKTWLRQLNEALVPEAISTPKQTVLKAVTPSLNKINNEADLQQIISQVIADNNLLSLAVIPDDFLKPSAIRYMVFNDTQTTYYLETSNSEDLFGQSCNNYSLSILARLFTCPNPKVLPNYKNTLHILSLMGLGLTNVTGDLTLAHYVQNSKDKHDLTTIYANMLNIEVIDILNNTQKASKTSAGSKDILINDLSNIVANCTCLENIITSTMSDKELKLYREVELPLVKVLVEMENNGIELDLAQFNKLDKELSKQLKNLENLIYADANTVFNINSPKQLQDVLFNQLKIPVTGIKKNTSGYSTDEDSLKILEQSGLQIAKYLLEYRTLSKLLGTYVSKLPLLVDKHNKLHTTYDQASVASGRLSSRDPNLQNIPVRNDWGKQIRRCFIASPGYKLVCADYSQIELRILAHYSQDKNLIEAFNTNQDIHAITASEILNKPINTISKDERRYAKIINFSLLYGKT